MDTSKEESTVVRTARARRWPTIVLGVSTLVFAAGTVVGFVTGGPGVGHFRTPEGREAYVAAYADAIAAMPAPSETYDIRTSFGIVRAYEWSTSPNPERTPVLLLPGRSSGAPMWTENLAILAANRTVYALDPLGDAGMSASTVPLRTMADQATWVDETLDGLGLTAVHVVGHSFGGSVAAALAVHRPERIVTLSLLEPVFVMSRPSVATMFWATIASVGFLPDSWRDRALARIGGVDESDLRSDDPLARMITAAVDHYATALPTPSPLSDDELRGLPMPVYLAIGGDDSLAGGQGALDRAEDLIPHVETRAWAGATHSLPMQVPRELGRALETFWLRHDRP